MKTIALLCLLVCGMARAQVTLQNATLKNATLGNAPASGGGYNPTSDAGVIEWLKADAMSLADNTATDWTASIGVNLTESTHKPFYRTAVQNSLPMIQFVSGSTTQTRGVFGGGALTQPFSIAIVYKYDGANASEAILSGYNNDVRFWNRGATGTGNISAYANGSDYVALYASDLVAHIAIVTFNGASSTYQLDGGTAVTFSASPGTMSLDGLTLGAIEGGGGSFGDSYIGEVIVRNAAFASPSAVISYLNARWSTF